MSNEERGEIDWVVGDKTYVLRLGINAICALEAKLSAAAEKRVTFDEVLANVRAGSMTDAVELLWAALQRYQKGQFPTTEPVGDLIDSAGGARVIVEKVGTLIDRLMQVNQPPEALRQAAGGEGTSNPPDAQGGTGSVSTLTPVVSV